MRRAVIGVTNFLLDGLPHHGVVAACDSGDLGKALGAMIVEGLLEVSIELFGAVSRRSSGVGFALDVSHSLLSCALHFLEVSISKVLWNPNKKLDKNKP